LALVDEIPAACTIAFDTNPIIYFVEENERFLPALRPLFRRISEGGVNAVVSAVTLAEVLVRPLRLDRPDLVQQYRGLLQETPNLRILSLDVLVAEAAAAIRARAGLTLPDAIVAATALTSECAYLITNDSAFRRVENLSVLVIDEYA
jgi:predicted nucleic acid-binding protein